MKHYLRGKGKVLRKYIWQTVCQSGWAVQNDGFMRAVLFGLFFFILVLIITTFSIHKFLKELWVKIEQKLNEPSVKSNENYK